MKKLKSFQLISDYNVFLNVELLVLQIFLKLQKNTKMQKINLSNYYQLIQRNTKILLLPRNIQSKALKILLF